MKIEMQPNETKIDTWTILYIPPNGGRYNGKLTITNKRLISISLFIVAPFFVLAQNVGIGTTTPFLDKSHS
ncbi:MAG: hypothetical protein ABIP79_06245 [Chitinophagaceae bacterium]